MFKRVSLGMYRTRDTPWFIANRENIITFLTIAHCESAILSSGDPKQRNHYITFWVKSWKEDEENKEIIKLINKHFLGKKK